ncbi:MAG TPA: hypothetical protein VE871_09485 [Longimicrobium sp.]|nr:hypothetical protein [Longimicrobium sp.]
MPYESLTPREVCDALGALGLSVAPADVVLERREGRWMARLPGGRLAWFAATDSARAALAAERRLLRTLAVRCGFGVPRVLLEAADGDLDVRSMVPGIADPWPVHARQP